MVSETTVLIVLVSIVLLEILLVYFIFIWMKKNNILYQVSIVNNGVLEKRGQRCRHLLIDNKQYLVPMLDFFKRRKIELKGNWKDYLLTIEGTPFIGVKSILKTYIGWDNLNYKNLPEVYYKLPYTDPKSHLINKEELLHFTHIAKKDILERTAYKPSDMELLKQMVFRGSIIVLALACIIFFPKIHESIAAQGNEVYGAAINKFTGVINRVIPVG